MLIFKNKDSELEQKHNIQRKINQIKHKTLILVVVLELWETSFKSLVSKFLQCGLVKNNCYLQGKKCNFQ